MTVDEFTDFSENEEIQKWYGYQEYTTTQQHQIYSNTTDIFQDVVAKCKIFQLIWLGTIDWGEWQSISNQS